MNDDEGIEEGSERNSFDTERERGGGGGREREREREREGGREGGGGREGRREVALYSQVLRAKTKQNRSMTKVHTMKWTTPKSTQKANKKL